MSSRGENNYLVLADSASICKSHILRALKYGVQRGEVSNDAGVKL
jgi:hypothetical protein